MCEVQRIPMAHQTSFREQSRGVEVECWPYNNHYSAEMAIQRGLSVLGLETLWLDFPCVAILLCPWITGRPVFLCIFLKQFNGDTSGHRFQGMSNWKRCNTGKVRRFLELVPSGQLYLDDGLIYSTTFMCKREHAVVILHCLPLSLSCPYCKASNLNLRFPLPVSCSSCSPALCLTLSVSRQSLCGINAQTCLNPVSLCCGAG